MRRLFDLLEEAARNAVRAADLLVTILEQWPDAAATTREMVDCEHEGDRITHDIFSWLNEGGKMAFDRQDVITLASALDDIVDFTEEVADFLGLYKIEAPMEAAEQMARVLRDAARQIAEAMPRLRKLQDIHPQRLEVNRLEDEGDRIYREAVAALFDHGIDPMLVIRWKDLFERLEEAIDATERTANTLEGIIIKHGK
ncbi:DUF47 domain-containing protein [Solirubrobacter sp. CPCC 204708]|uniref:DUF47 family protein n=1 Tax=Solirubrobacter deserti TaxID=2282478 RepID=A0ABT4RSH5_9ACTN|nr:DUF47 family protein [Solirubrobacter deserti]MBE2316372.1 DUF47 domain-containing protein [Solirubrobacter deserti]MDA0141548.1 DUF47 family protein [Solirubrobacter deserti]